MEVACLQKKKILQQVRAKIKMRICMLYPWHHTAFIIWFLYSCMGLALSHINLQWDRWENDVTDPKWAVDWFPH